MQRSALSRWWRARGGIRWQAFAWLALVCLVATGCGRANVAPVSGRVTVDGEPAESIIVSFTPIGEAAATAGGSSGRTDADGRYSLSVVGEGIEGAAIGTHRVTFAFRDEASFELTEEEYAEAAERGELTTIELPEEARDGSIQFEVPPEGTEQADFDF